MCMDMPLGRWTTLEGGLCGRPLVLSCVGVVTLEVGGGGAYTENTKHTVSSLVIVNCTKKRQA